MPTLLAKTTRGTLPRVPFLAIAERILGKSYELSVVLVGKSRMEFLNRTYRGKDGATDILAFPLAKDSGEIVIHVPSADTKAKLFSMTPRQYLIFLFIHGCLHLKGMQHGATMDRQERLLLKRFTRANSSRTLNVPTHRNRH